MKVAVIQLCSELNYQKNLNQINKLIQQAKTDLPGLQAVFLPEVFYSMSDGTKPTEYLVESENEHYRNIQNIAKNNQVHIIGGSAATKENGKIFNRAYNFSSEGVDLGLYDKQHLFALSLKGKDKANLDESKVYSAGKEKKLLELEGFKVGLSICFDLRFPELYRSYFESGANILTVASAFTVPTGKAHWKSLLRARAIENQSYVIAANQWGTHNEKIKTYGHSLIIDPWGEVLADAGEGEGVISAELSLRRVEQIRQRMDVSARVNF